MFENDDAAFSRCYTEGRRAARIGGLLTSNPYLDITSVHPAAWVEGHASVDNTVLDRVERADIFKAGALAAAGGETASTCPYIADEDPERFEIWLLGYAPHVDG